MSFSVRLVIGVRCQMPGASVKHIIFSVNDFNYT